MKLRKNGLILRKNFPFPPWRFFISQRAIWEFPPRKLDSSGGVASCQERYDRLAARADRGAAPAELMLRIVDGGKLSGRNTLYRHATDQLIAA